MTSLSIHPQIHSKLDYFIHVKKIPNIIFHGPSGSGKRTIVYNFIKKIYHDDKTLIKNHVMSIDCGHGKGIKFIRDDLKFFAKTNIHNVNNESMFKSIILLNADKLTIDAQSALRRCIELFSHSTRFFIVIEEKMKLLRPILSRFCDIFVALPNINNKTTNLHKYRINETYSHGANLEKTKTDYLKTQMNKLTHDSSQIELTNITNKLYEKGISSLDVIKYIENLKTFEELQKYTLLTYLEKIKKEFRNEKLFMFTIFNFMFIRNNTDLENISFM